MPIIATDSSGNGHHLFYSNPDVVFGVPGYVTGDFMVQNINPTSGFLAGSTLIDMTSLSGNDLFFNVWTDQAPPAGTGPGYVAFQGAHSDISFSSFQTTPPGTTGITLVWTNTGGGGPVNITAAGSFPAGPHMVSVRLDLAGLGGQFYLDGAPFGSFCTASGAMPTLNTIGTMAIGGKNFPGAEPFYDEIAVGATATVDADFSNLYAQAGNFANYDAAQMAMVPEYYYHLGEGVGTGWHVGVIGMSA